VILNVVVFAVVFAAVLLGLRALGRKGQARRAAARDNRLDAARFEALDSAWEATAAETTNRVGQLILAAARPLAGHEALDQVTRGRFGRRLELRIAAAGYPFGGSADVFLALQTAAVAVGALIVFSAVLFDAMLLKVVLCFVGVAGAYWPWEQLTKRAKARSQLISETLPDFAEILQMPLLAGAGSIGAALSFTASRIEGPVSDAARHLVSRLAGSSGISDVDAFALAGEELGTPEAKAFFNALARSYFEGVRVAETIQVQAAQLREQTHQRRRGELRKLPTKLIFVFAAHFLPLVFILTLVPSITAISGI